MSMKNESQAIVVSLLLVMILLTQLFKFADTKSTTTSLDTTTTNNNNNNVQHQIAATTRVPPSSVRAPPKNATTTAARVDVGEAEVARKAINIGNLLTVVEAIKGSMEAAGAATTTTTTESSVNDRQTVSSTNNNIEETFLEAPIALPLAGVERTVIEPLLITGASTNTKTLAATSPLVYYSNDWNHHWLADRLNWLVAGRLQSQQKPFDAAYNREMMNFDLPQQSMYGDRFRRNKRSLTIWRKMSQILGRQQQSAPVPTMSRQLAATAATGNSNNYQSNHHNLNLAARTNELYNDNYKTHINAAPANDYQQQSLDCHEKEKNHLVDNSGLIANGQQQQQYLPDQSEQIQEIQNIENSLANHNAVITDNGGLNALGSIVASRQKKTEHFENHSPIRFNNCFFNSISCF